MRMETLFLTALNIPMSTVMRMAIHTPILTRMNMAMKMITIMTMSMDAREAVTPAAAAAAGRLRTRKHSLQLFLAIC